MLFTEYYCTLNCSFCELKNVCLITIKEFLCLFSYIFCITLKVSHISVLSLNKFNWLISQNIIDSAFNCYIECLPQRNYSLSFQMFFSYEVHLKKLSLTVKNILSNSSLGSLKGIVASHSCFMYQHFFLKEVKEHWYTVCWLKVTNS